jgi:hypothetical protein
VVYPSTKERNGAVKSASKSGGEHRVAYATGEVAFFM